MRGREIERKRGRDRQRERNTHKKKVETGRRRHRECTTGRYRPRATKERARKGFKPPKEGWKCDVKVAEKRLPAGRCARAGLHIIQPSKPAMREYTHTEHTTRDRLDIQTATANHDSDPSA